MGKNETVQVLHRHRANSSPYFEKYNQTPARKAYMKKYNQQQAVKEYMKAYRKKYMESQEHRDARKAYMTAYRKETRSKLAKTRRYQERRITVFLALGGKCVKCGNSDPRVLQVDHINGGGSKENKTIGSFGIYQNVLKNPAVYQLLCANCNWIKRYENYEERRMAALQKDGDNIG